MLKMRQEDRSHQTTPIHDPICILLSPYRASPCRLYSTQNPLSPLADFPLALDLVATM